MPRRPRPAVDLDAHHLTSTGRRVLELVRTTVPPVHRAGFPFVTAALAAAVLGRRHRWLRTAGLAAAGANAAFFRHPARVPPTRAGVVVAAADGQICLIENAAPPPELGLPDVAVPRISIFLSLLDAHVQRAPLGGEVIAAVHRPGQFVSAERVQASTDNERNSVVIRDPDGHQVIAVQIAGLLARRIICDLHPGDTVAIGDTYGLIRFGSRLDTYLPAGSTVLVSVGQRAVAGETVVAELP